MLVFAFASAAACAASVPPPAGPAATPCVDRLVPYTDFARLEAANALEWSVDVGIGGGGVVLVGMLHSDDPSDPQFDQIDRAWSAAHPTVAYYEGPDRPIAVTRDETIATTGESGYVRFLARRDGVPVKRLEPDPRAEAAYILARHPRDQAGLFYVLREIVRLRDRKDVPREAFPAAIREMASRASAMGLADMFPSMEEFEASYRKYLGDPADWRDAPGEWFSPLPRDRELFTHRINRDSSEFRNRNMYAVLTADARADQRVFGVVGKHHVPMIAPALRCEAAR